MVSHQNAKHFLADVSTSEPEMVVPDLKSIFPGSGERVSVAVLQVNKVKLAKLWVDGAVVG